MPNRPAGKLSQSDGRARPSGSRLPAVGGRSDVLSRRTAARETYENHCDSFCDRREANRGYSVLIGIPPRPDLLVFWPRLSILDWLVVPVAEGSNPSTHPTKSNISALKNGECGYFVAIWRFQGPPDSDFG